VFCFGFFLSRLEKKVLTKKKIFFFIFSISFQRLEDYERLVGFKRAVLRFPEESEPFRLGLNILGLHKQTNKQTNRKKRMFPPTYQTNQTYAPKINAKLHNSNKIKLH